MASASSILVVENLDSYEVKLLLDSNYGQDSYRKLLLEYIDPVSELTKTEVVYLEGNKADTTLLPRQKDDKVDPYTNAEIVAATLEGDTLAVVLRLDTKTNTYRPVIPELRNSFDSYLEDWDGYDYLFRSYEKDKTGKWTSGLSIYLDTIYPDIENNKITEIVIRDTGVFNLLYQGYCLLVGDLNDRFANKYKYYNGESITTKKFKYSYKEELLYVLTETEKAECIEGAMWWYGFDEISLINESAQSLYHTKQTQERKRNDHGVQCKEYIYIRKANNMDVNPLEEDMLNIYPVQKTISDKRTNG